MEWWRKLDAMKRAIVVLVLAFVAGISTGASGVTAIALPARVGRNTASLDSVKVQLDYIETALVYHICEMNGNHDRPIAECVAATRRMIALLDTARR